MVKNLPAMKKTQVWSLGRKDPLEKGMATLSSILAWRIPRTEKLGGLQSMESQRVSYIHTYTHNAYTHTHTHTHMLIFACTYIQIYICTCVHTHTHSNVASTNGLFCPWNNNTSCPSKKSVYVAPSDMPSPCQASSIPWATSNATGMLCGWPLAGTYSPTTWPGNQGKEILVMDRLKIIIGQRGIQPADLKPFPVCHWEFQEEPWRDHEVGFHDVTQAFYVNHGGITHAQLKVLGKHGGGASPAKFCSYQLQDLEQTSFLTGNTKLLILCYSRQ